MGVWRKIKIARKLVSRSLNAGFQMKCKVCGRPLRAGDVVWSRSKGNCYFGPRTVHYCGRCYEKLWV